ncbi:hypothetical protein QQP08_026396 [Theobroma cacao]|nr:hypothetical protein QQP08_026396 [Theobroma cacao]
MGLCLSIFGCLWRQEKSRAKQPIPCINNGFISQTEINRQCYVYILQRRAALDECLPQESQRSTSIQGLLEKDSIAFVMMQGEFAE